MAQLVKSLLCKHENLSWITRTFIESQALLCDLGTLALVNWERQISGFHWTGTQVPSENLPQEIGWESDGRRHPDINLWHPCLFTNTSVYRYIQSYSWHTNINQRTAERTVTRYHIMKSLHESWVNIIMIIKTWSCIYDKIRSKWITYSLV